MSDPYTDGSYNNLLDPHTNVFGGTVNKAKKSYFSGIVDLSNNVDGYDDSDNADRAIAIIRNGKFEMAPNTDQSIFKTQPNATIALDSIDTDEHSADIISTHSFGNTSDNTWDISFGKYYGTNGSTLAHEGTNSELSRPSGVDSDGKTCFLVCDRDKFTVYEVNDGTVTVKGGLDFSTLPYMTDAYGCGMSHDTKTVYFGTGSSTSQYLNIAVWNNTDKDYELKVKNINLYNRRYQDGTAQGGGVEEYKEIEGHAYPTISAVSYTDLSNNTNSAITQNTKNKFADLIDDLQANESTYSTDSNNVTTYTYKGENTNDSDLNLADDNGSRISTSNSLTYTHLVVRYRMGTPQGGVSIVYVTLIFYDDTDTTYTTSIKPKAVYIIEIKNGQYVHPTSANGYSQATFTGNYPQETDTLYHVPYTSWLMPATFDYEVPVANSLVYTDNSYNVTSISDQNVELNSSVKARFTHGQMSDDGKRMIAAATVNTGSQSYYFAYSLHSEDEWGTFGIKDIKGTIYNTSNHYQYAMCQMTGDGKLAALTTWGSFNGSSDPGVEFYETAPSNGAPYTTTLELNKTSYTTNVPYNTLMYTNRYKWLSNRGTFFIVPLPASSSSAALIYKNTGSGYIYDSDAPFSNPLFDANSLAFTVNRAQTDADGNNFTISTSNFGVSISENGEVFTIGEYVFKYNEALKTWKYALRIPGYFTSDDGISDNVARTAMVTDNGDYIIADHDVYKLNFSGNTVCYKFSLPKDIHFINTHHIKPYIDEVPSSERYIGSINQNGLEAISKNFLIPHPVLPNMSLRHSNIETPELKNVYNGSSQLLNGQVSVNLDEYFNMTEGTFVLINKEAYVITTNESDYDPVKGSISGNILQIECQDSHCNGTVTWIVFALRDDIAIKQTNLLDKQGKYISEFMNVVI